MSFALPLDEAFRVIVEASPDPTFVLDPADPSVPLRIVYSNPATSECYGYTPEELLGQSIVALLDTPQSAARAAVHAQAIMSGVPQVFHAIHRKKDGSEFPIEVKARLVTIDGRPYVLGISRDSTAWHCAQQELNDREQRLRAVIGASPACIKLIAPTGEVLEINESGAAMLGLVPHEVVGRAVFDLIAEEHRESFRAFHRRVMSGERATAKYDVVSTQGERRTLESVAVPLAQPGGGVVHLGITYDVTDRERLELQLRQAQKLEAIGRLSGGIAHDFNNLLTVITGNLELAREGGPIPDAVLEALGEIEAASARATALTQQLLTFSRQQTLVLEPVRLDQIALQLDRMLRRLIREDVTLRCDLAAVAPIQADKSQIEQVVVNLVVNARTAMPAGGCVTVTTADVLVTESTLGRPSRICPGEFVRLSVEDTGHGMTPDVLARIFEPFFTTRSPGEGTGLGLATVHGIVEQLGGFITVQSKPRNGARFDLFFPRAVATEAAAPSTETESAPSRVRRNETVLLVEDEEMVRRVARKALEVVGHRVIEAQDGVEALALASAHGEPIHVLVTDVVMPNLGGRALAERLLVLYPALRVLFMSGYTHDLEIDRAVAEEGLAYVQKPFKPSELVARVGELFADAAVDRPRSASPSFEGVASGGVSGPT